MPEANLFGEPRDSVPSAKRDRVAKVMLERWTKVASLEGGITGAFGVIGVPVNFLLVVYFQIALVVSIAEAYGFELEGESGEDALLSVVGRAHGMEDIVRASPRILGAIAKTLLLRHGMSLLGRLVPLVAAPLSAKLNERDMVRIGGEALRRFGNVVAIEK